MFYFNLDVLNQSYFLIAVETLNFLKICTLRKDEFRFYMPLQYFLEKSREKNNGWGEKRGIYLHRGGNIWSAS